MAVLEAGTWRHVWFRVVGINAALVMWSLVRPCMIRACNWMSPMPLERRPLCLPRSVLPEVGWVLCQRRAYRKPRHDADLHSPLLPSCRSSLVCCFPGVSVCSCDHTYHVLLHLPPGKLDSPTPCHNLVHLS